MDPLLRFLSFLFCIVVLLIVSPSPVQSQQPYIRQATTACDVAENSSSVLGYTCNGLHKTCQSYLTFRSQVPYNSVSSISILLGSDPSELALLNSVSADATFDTGKIILVPVDCSCSGNHYQTNTSYVLRQDDSYFSVANNTFQGLSTCQALQAQNNILAANLFPGTRINVPLRCACPTKNQTALGVKYLLTYFLTFGDTLEIVMSMFGAETVRTVEANELSSADDIIFAFTTLLIPLQNPPLSTQVVGSTPPPPPSPPLSPPPRNSNTSKKNTWVYVLVGVLGGVIFFLVSGIIVFFLLFRKAKKKSDFVQVSETFESIEKPSERTNSEYDSKEFFDSLSDIAQSLKVYAYTELQTATNNFSRESWVSGSVYRGTINGDYAAIKKIDGGDASKEVALLNKISHFNLIRLSGVCYSSGNWFLVYEYAVNGPLSGWIHGPLTGGGDQKFLSWTKRMQIALDVAMGLNYIHNYTSPPYVHKDVKTSNVLLDRDFRAKLANFALARSAEKEDGQFTLTRHIVGTRGYMAPEYLEDGFVSTKLDVYAFGVLMLEMLTGKEVSVLYAGVNSSLTEVLSPVIGGDDGMENLRAFMDRSLQGNYPVELALLVAKLVDRCLQKEASARPGMDEVMQSLSRVMITSLNWEMPNSASGY